MSGVPEIHSLTIHSLKNWEVALESILKSTFMGFFHKT